MSTIAAIDPLLVAEDVWSYVRPWPNQVLDDQGDLVLWHGQNSHYSDANVLRVRLEAASVDRRIDEVCAWMGAHGRDRFTWWLGASTTPDDLVARLRVRGAEPDPDDPILTPMALDHEPPPPPPGVDVEPVTTIEDWASCREIIGEGYGMPEQDRAAARERLAREWAYARADGNLRFLARVDGEPVAYAILMRLIVGPPHLGGAATLPKARGRGVYRALVRARWDAAVELGARGVVTLAEKNARPILEHFGFRSAPPVQVLVDRADREHE